ncbi:Carboxylesterase NlhH [Maioricimonas rarisocia]|uniref:Carboxylesterase NlhH n=1 Tax=Maioricimonas rarisocia TaxID=2528026 RepID=A0A517ZA81_9PLAN|nr:alpha/beta hydrolase [Maioricimonas rarisocia]QDU39402.1 Carboxylesterase NlhH [Maioricimonas rarisocia]
MRALIALLLLATSVSAAEMQVHRDLSYVERGTARQSLDLYAPADGRDRPVLIWIHGGGWRIGDKRNVQLKPQALVEHGYVFVSVGYRFVPDVDLDAMAGDIAAAIRWVHDHAREYRGSPDHLFIAGHSAGAHLAALVCTNERYLAEAGLTLGDISGCIPVDTAAYDVPELLKSRRRRRSLVYTSAFTTDATTQKRLSPITHVVRDKQIPGFLILHVASRPDSTARSQAFAQRLRDAGVAARVVPAHDKTHATINRELGKSDDPPTRALFQWLDERTRPAGTGTEPAPTRPSQD